MTDFGTDLVTLPNENGIIDILPTLQYATGLDVLAQSLVRRQVCVRNSIIDSRNEGIDLRTYLKDGLTQQAPAQLPSVVRTELKRDQRVREAVVTGTYDTAKNELTLFEVITSADGPFTLTLTVSAVSVAAIVGSP